MMSTVEEEASICDIVKSDDWNRSTRGMGMMNVMTMWRSKERGKKASQPKRSDRVKILFVSDFKASGASTVA